MIGMSALPGSSPLLVLFAPVSFGKMVLKSKQSAGGVSTALLLWRGDVHPLVWV